MDISSVFIDEGFTQFWGNRQGISEMEFKFQRLQDPPPVLKEKLRLSILKTTLMTSGGTVAKKQSQIGSEDKR